MDKIRVSAKTKDEAITKALIQLGITSDRLDYTVLVEGKSGLFGIGAKPWIIEASAKAAPQKSEIERLEKEIHSITSGKAVEKKPAAPKAAKSTNEKENAPKAMASEKKVDATAPEVKEEKSEAVKEEQPRERVRRERPEARERSDRRPRRERSERGDRRSDRPMNKRYPRGGYEVQNMSILNTPEPERKVREIKPVSAEEAEAAQKKAEEFITALMKGMNMDVSISASFHAENNELLLNMEGPDMGILIGKRGQTLDSLQYLTSLVINKEHKEDYIRVKLDTEDYRSRREATLRNLARNIAYKVRRSRKPVALEPMNPYERRIIHSALQNDRYVTTRSEGDEPFRHVIIYMKKKDRKPYPQDEKRVEKPVSAVEEAVTETTTATEVTNENV
ncbi:MAG TPA: RNA-binding protein [Oribacterium sp.]|nr:RNA-binding protein [Oribacterium sp.]